MCSEGRKENKKENAWNFRVSEKFLLSILRILMVFNQFCLGKSEIWIVIFWISLEAKKFNFTRSEIFLSQFYRPNSSSLSFKFHKIRNFFGPALLSKFLKFKLNIIKKPSNLFFLFSATNWRWKKYLRGRYRAESKWHRVW